MVSHDLHLVMAKTDEVICLNQHICCFGNPAIVSNDPEFISLFGKHSAEKIAVYKHNHNHLHDFSQNTVYHNLYQGRIVLPHLGKGR